MMPGWNVHSCNRLSTLACHDIRDGIKDGIANSLDFLVGSWRCWLILLLLLLLLLVVLTLLKGCCCCMATAIPSGLVYIVIVSTVLVNVIVLSFPLLVG